MFPFPPSTPEEEEADRKARAARVVEFHRRIEPMLPLAREAQRLLREIGALGATHRGFKKAQKGLAVFAEELETELQRQPE